MSAKKGGVWLTSATLILVLFVGLRFETGADWAEYETLMLMTAPLFSTIPMYFDPNLIVEPGFVFLLKAVNTLDLSFQAVLFLSALFSIGVLSIFLWRYCPQPTLVLLWYCGFGLLLGQMAAIRQVIAYAFLLMAFMAYDKGRNVLSLVWVLLAISMHVFAIALAPLIYLRFKPPRTSVIIALCSFGLALSIAGISTLALLAAPLSLIFGGIVSTKLEVYNVSTGYEISPFAFLLTFWHGTVIAVLNRVDLKPSNHAVVRCAIYAAIFTLVAHTFFATSPAIWNRLMVFSMPLEMLSLFRCYGNLLRQRVGPLTISIGIWIIATFSVGYGLSQENALPYVPYRSLIQVWATGDPGDGRFRYSIEQRRQDRLAEEQRRY